MVDTDILVILKLLCLLQKDKVSCIGSFNVYFIFNRFHSGVSEWEFTNGRSG